MVGTIRVSGWIKTSNSTARFVPSADADGTGPPV